MLVARLEQFTGPLQIFEGLLRRLVLKVGLAFFRAINHEARVFPGEKGRGGAFVSVEDLGLAQILLKHDCRVV